MTRPGDYGPEMSALRLLDDEAIEAITAGDPVVPELLALASFAEHVRSAGDRPAPAPSIELQALITAHARAVTRADRARRVIPPSLVGSTARVSHRRLTSIGSRVAGLGIAAKVALGVSIATAGVAGAGVTGALPGPADEVVRDAIEAVTPLDLPNGDSPAGDQGPAGPRPHPPLPPPAPTPRRAAPPAVAPRPASGLRPTTPRGATTPPRAATSRAAATAPPGATGSTRAAAPRPTRPTTTLGRPRATRARVGPATTISSATATTARVSGASGGTTPPASARTHRRPHPGTPRMPLVTRGLTPEWLGTPMPPGLPASTPSASRAGVPSAGRSPSAPGPPSDPDGAAGGLLRPRLAAGGQSGL